MRPPPCAGAAGLDRRAVGIGDAGLVPAAWNLPEFVSASAAAFSRSSGRCHKAESEQCWLIRAKMSLIGPANILIAQAVMTLFGGRAARVNLRRRTMAGRHPGCLDWSSCRPARAARERLEAAGCSPGNNLAGVHVMSG